MNTCLYCRGNGPFTTVEHVIPESLGNDDLMLAGCICNACQAYFGKEVEQYVLAKSPFAFWRTLLGIPTKKSQLPSVNLSQPTKATGRLPAIHKGHDNVGYTHHPDGSTSADIYDDDTVQQVLNHTKQQFNLVLSPKLLSMMGRFLGKLGLGVLATSARELAYSAKFDQIRGYARFGNLKEIWPIFHFQDQNGWQYRKPKLLGPHGEVILEEVECYSYKIVEVNDLFTLFQFSMSTDNWIIALNTPYPPPLIEAAFPGQELQLIWYPAEQWNTNQPAHRSPVDQTR